MIDIILFLFSLGLFVFGFWCGSKYSTWTKLGEAIKARLFKASA
jgi:hypothetical protein